MPSLCTLCQPELSRCQPVMLVLGLGLGLGLAIGWPWPWDCGLGLGLRGLALAKDSRPKSWRTTMFTMNFHRLEWIIFQDPHTLLTYRANTGDSAHFYLTVSCQWWVMLLNCACILVRVLEKTGFHYFIFHRKPLHWYGHGLGLGLDQLALALALALSVLALLTSLLSTHQIHL